MAYVMLSSLLVPTDVQHNFFDSKLTRHNQQTTSKLYRKERPKEPSSSSTASQIFRWVGATRFRNLSN